MNVSLVSTVYQMQELVGVKYKYGISSLLNIRPDVMSSSQAAYPDTQQEASSTIPPTTTSITRLRWSASRRIWRDTSPGRSALRPSWGYAAPKVCWHTRDCSVEHGSTVFITENIFETLSFLSSLVENCLLPLLWLFFFSVLDWCSLQSLTHFLSLCLSAGLSIHTFHGNFFVRSTDLLSLPNVNPDAGFAVQMSIEENLDDMQVVSFQAALLYTSSKGTRTQPGELMSFEKWELNFSWLFKWCSLSLF